MESLYFLDILYEALDALDIFDLTTWRNSNTHKFLFRVLSFALFSKQIKFQLSYDNQYIK